MTEQDRTLAPWIVKPLGGETQHFSVQSENINAGDYVAEVYTLADATAIAAFPDLLDALREMIRWWENDGGSMDALIDRGRAAIAKAEGR